MRLCSVFELDFMTVFRLLLSVPSCNSLNDSFRWVKFVWDSDANDLCCRVDGVIELDSCAKEVYELMARMAGIVDEAYPRIMKALWA